MACVSAAELAVNLGKNPFWLRKIRTAFVALDTNKDGFLSVDDFTLMAKEFGEKCPERAEEVSKTLTNSWTVSAGGDKDAKLTMQDWIDTRIKFTAMPNAQYMFRHYESMKFDAINHDRSGLISPSEFKDYFECMRIDTKHAPASFKALDANGDGNITKDEFLDAAIEYRFGDDENHPSQLFYGPLVEH